MLSLSKFSFRSKDHNNQTYFQNRRIKLWNIGLANVPNSDSLMELVVKSVPNISHTLSMPAGASHCFFEFASHRDAASFYEQCQGRLEFSTNERREKFLLTFEDNDALCDLSYYLNGVQLINKFATPEQAKYLASLASTDLRLDQSLNPAITYVNDEKNPDAPKSIPQRYRVLLESLKDINIEKDLYNHLTLQKFSPNLVTPLPIDKNDRIAQEPILVLSLQSGYKMKCARAKPRDSLNKNDVSIYIPSRSLLIINGEALREWHFSISNYKTGGIDKFGPRLLLILRKKSVPKNLPMNPISLISDKVAPKVEEALVHLAYNKKANLSREKILRKRPKVVQFIKDLKCGSFLLDVGCRLVEHIENPNIVNFGVDITAHFIKICREKNYEVAHGNCLHLPYRKNSLDAVICNAVHHISTEERRRQAIAEVMRVLRPGGKALISVKSNQESLLLTYTYNAKSRETSKLYKKNIDVNKKPNYEVFHRTFCDDDISVILPIYEKKSTEFYHSDLFVQLEGDVFIQKDSEPSCLLYYHIFHDEDELQKLCTSVPRTIVEKIYHEQGYWYAILKKM